MTCKKRKVSNFEKFAFFLLLMLNGKENIFSNQEYIDENLFTNDD